MFATLIAQQPRVYLSMKEEADLARERDRQARASQEDQDGFLGYEIKDRHEEETKEAKKLGYPGHPPEWLAIFHYTNHVEVVWTTKNEGYRRSRHNTAINEQEE